MIVFIKCSFIFNYAKKFSFSHFKSQSTCILNYITFVVICNSRHSKWLYSIKNKASYVINTHISPAFKH